MYSLQSLPWLAIPAALIAFAVRHWWQYRNGSLRHSQQRTKRLYLLASNVSWRKAHPLALQLATFDALGVVLPDLTIQFALERHNCWGLLRDCKQAIGWAALNPGASRFEDTRTRLRVDYNWTAKALYILAGLPVCALLLTADWLSPVVSIPLFLVALPLVPMMFWFAIQFEAADRLINRLDALYPLATSSVTVQESNAVESPKKAGRTKRSKAVEISA